IPASGLSKMPRIQALQKTALDHSHIGVKTLLHHGRQPQKPLHLQVTSSIHALMQDTDDGDAVTGRPKINDVLLTLRRR
ncbi:hypothetical protein U1708_19470, partial [Sphingomonas sp. ZB1N12]|uniref:hypothetical protein n=1 Tax=Sphingomonas arabinosi TaxID=3096160 RepID=UPI002FC8853A